MSNPEFFTIMAFYNLTIWPVTVLTIILGLVAIVLAVRKTDYSDQLISLILVFLWLWVGIVFGFIFYGTWTANVFGIPLPGFGLFYTVLFTLQGIILFYYGVIRKSLSFKFSSNIYSILGLFLIIWALALYLPIGYASGYPYPYYPLFGTSPCPVAILTIGLFLWADKRISPLVILIPIVYGLMGVLPVLAFGIYADIGLIIAGIIGIVLLYKHWKWPHDSEE